VDNPIDVDSLVLVFTSIIYEALPFIVLGVVIAGLLEEFVPQQFMSRIIPRNRPLAIALGGMLGLVFPMCECGIIVVMKRLLRKGLPLSVCVSYMLAGPVINVVVMLSTFVAFNPPDPKAYILGGPYVVVFLRCALAYVTAFFAALVVDWQYRVHGDALLHPSITKGLKQVEANDTQDSGPKTWSQSLTNISETALHDFIDIMAFLVLGSAVAAIGRVVLAGSDMQNQIQNEPALSILIMMGIAVLFCLCSEADAFVAANFQTFWPPASKLAFLVLGPMLDIKLYIMYTRVFRPRLIFTIILAVVVQVFIYTLIVHYAEPHLASLWVQLTGQPS
jgi:uncharacterized membrane protein YraQ (UPF0718 family)